MVAQRALNQYRQTQVQSRTPLELVVLLYDGALTELEHARGAIARNDIRARRDAIGRVLAIVSELQSTLNMEAGGAIAASLDELYGYCTTRVMQATIDNAAAPLDEVSGILSGLRESWQTIASQQV